MTLLPLSLPPDLRLRLTQCAVCLFIPAAELWGQGTPAERGAQPPTEHLIHVRDPRIESLTRAWRESPSEMQGFRIQVFTGSLQDARLLRSQLRNQTHLPVYLTSLPPNYQILVGDFRDRWSAEKERENWVVTFPSALVLPSAVELPHGPKPAPPEETAAPGE